jgi:hypothetical protein
LKHSGGKTEEALRIADDREEPYEDEAENLSEGGFEETEEAVPFLENGPLKEPTKSALPEKKDGFNGSL